MNTVKRTIYVRVFGLEGYDDYGFDLDVDMTRKNSWICIRKQRMTTSMMHV